MASSRIDNIFTRLRASGHTTLIPFITAGHPSLEATAAVVGALESAGSGVVELGIPFSDSIADGPVIAASMHEALRAGVTPQAIFETIRGLRPHTGIGLVAMVSNSIVERMGPERFVADAAEAGFDGLIIPDLDFNGGRPPPVGRLAARTGLALSLLVAPTTSEHRLRRIVSLCSGFVYVLARTGITGERQTSPDVSARVEAVRRHTDLPVAVGFGISRPRHVAAATAAADAAVVGSALVRRLGRARDPAAEALTFAGSLAAACTIRGKSSGPPPGGRDR
ncbi:MAG: tryptophan synthase subunit alpha [Planctomycetota bacterium]